MSSQLKHLINEINTNKAPGEYFTVEDYVERIKKHKNFSRTNEKALKANVTMILNEMRKNSERTKENSEDGKLLTKKRKKDKESPEINDMNAEEFLFKPSIKFEDIGGMDEIIEEIKEAIGCPLQFYHIYKHMNIEPVKGMLLCGPPGCGKTTIAHAIGGEYDISFFKITAPQIVSSLSGESEMKIRRLFSKVVESAPSILFIDEIESILGKRENASKDMERRIVAQIMSCIDELSINQASLTAPVFIIGATSKPEFIDSSVRRSGRFDKEIHIGFPSQEMRERMLISIARDKKISNDVVFSDLAKSTPGYLAADLQSLVREAGRAAIKRIVNDISSNNDSDLSNYYLENRDFQEAIANIQPTSKREGFTTIPNVSWNDIGGLETLREELYYDIVMPILEPAKLKKVGIDRAAGVLLYGPPGCGKTLLAKAVANEAKSNFISIKGPELLNKYVGESERAVRQLFTRARNSSPCIIFFDELDALCPKRSLDNNAATERVVNQLLTEMDGLEERKQVFIIAATNRPDIIDPAMLRPGRLDKLLYVPLPTESDRLSILKTVTRKLPMNQDVDLTSISSDKSLEGFSGADLASLIRESQMNSLKRYNKSTDQDKFEVSITNEDLRAALKTIIPSVSKADKIKYEKLQKSLRESRSHIENDSTENTGKSK